MYLINTMHTYHIIKWKKKYKIVKHILKFGDLMNITKSTFFLNYAYLLNLLLYFDIMNIIFSLYLAWTDH